MVSSAFTHKLSILLGSETKFQFSLLFQKYIAAEEALNDFFKEVPFAKEACIQKLVDIQLQSFFRQEIHHPLMDAFIAPVFVNCDIKVIIYLF